jgi:hypothetical protein
VGKKVTESPGDALMRHVNLVASTEPVVTKHPEKTPPASPEPDKSDGVIEARPVMPSETKGDGNSDQIFYIARDEVNQFNYFLLNNSISINTENVLGLVKDAIRFLLLRPVVNFDVDLNTFSLKAVHNTRVLIANLKLHVPLFSAFDDNKIKKSSWGLNAIDKKMVRIMVKVDSITSESLQKSIKKAITDAKAAGWTGKLEIITASPIISTLP